VCSNKKNFWNVLFNNLENKLKMLHKMVVLRLGKQLGEDKKSPHICASERSVHVS
jgi:hypothetical protein